MRGMSISGNLKERLGIGGLKGRVQGLSERIYRPKRQLREYLELHSLETRVAVAEARLKQIEDAAAARKQEAKAQ
jgi:hypothetical protein